MLRIMELMVFGEAFDFSGLREGVFRCPEGCSVMLASTQPPSQTSICAGGVSSKLPPPCPAFA
eukprot:scaffold18342_cov138-Skeletonema_dohrnii-CCMP3373.AAC.2